MCRDRKTKLLALTALCCVALVGCSENVTDSVAPPLGDEVEAVSKSVVYEDGVTRYDGVIGGENLYAFLVPDDWNGELVLYAHGFIDADEPLALPTKDNVLAIRDRYVAMGFAWAYCSYRENGLAVKDGAWATRRLQKLFKAVVKSEPSHTWLVAHSLGGLIGVELVEKHPGEYDGILTMSGMVGGTKAQLDYVGDVRILFDLFYPGVLPGTVIDVPEGLDILFDVVYPAVGAIQADPTGLGIISMLQQTPLPGRDGEEFVESMVTALGFNVRAIHDVLERTNGRCPIDNLDTVYAPALPGLLPPEVLAMINAGAQRYSRPRPTENLFDRYYEPSGQLAIPMISLHDQYDPVVPLFHEDLYAAKVAAMGNSANLEQRVVDRYGHTDFSADEAATALMDLRAKAGVN